MRMSINRKSVGRRENVQIHSDRPNGVRNVLVSLVINAFLAVSARLPSTGVVSEHLQRTGSVNSQYFRSFSSVDQLI